MQIGEQVRPRAIRPESIELPAGYHIEPVASGLNYPTALSWDGQGRLLIAESTVPFGRVDPTEVRILRQEPDGALRPIAGGFEHLINDMAVDQGRLYVSQQDRISLVEDGQIRDIITGLPSWGLHQTNSLAFGPDGRLYFGQGTISNAGVVDSFALDHLQRAGRLQDHDIPGADIVLTGQNYESRHIFSGEARMVGAFVAWGTTTTPGQRIQGARPGQAASGAIMCANPDGSDLHVYAWGLRNPYGLAFAPDGRLYASNNGANRIPPRPVSGDPDTLWVVEEGAWYGWPDFFAGQPVTDPAFTPPKGPGNEFLIANHEELLAGRARPPAPLVSLGLHVSPCKFDFCRQPDFGFAGQIFLAEFGSLLTPVEGYRVAGREGHRVVRVDVERGQVYDFATNCDGLPASEGDHGGLERPVQARFGPDGSLYIVDLGALVLQADGWAAPAGQGVVWRISRT